MLKKNSLDDTESVSSDDDQHWGDQGKHRRRDVGFIYIAILCSPLTYEIKSRYICVRARKLSLSSSYHRTTNNTDHSRATTHSTTIIHITHQDPIFPRAPSPMLMYPCVKNIVFTPTQKRVRKLQLRVANREQSYKTNVFSSLVWHDWLRVRAFFEFTGNNVIHSIEYIYPRKWKTDDCLMCGDAAVLPLADCARDETRP